MDKPQIHPTAIVETAWIGDGTKVWHFTHIASTARIGFCCTIGQNVFIDDAVIGDYVKIQNNVSVYSGVTLEDYVFCGPSCVFTNVRLPRSEFRAPAYAKTLVKKGATIGANATIVCGVTIGEHACVGAGAVVTKNVPPYTIVVGNPARFHGWADRRGRICATKPEGESDE